MAATTSIPRPVFPLPETDGFASRYLVTTVVLNHGGLQPLRDVVSELGGHSPISTSFVSGSGAGRVPEHVTSRRLLGSVLGNARRVPHPGSDAEAINNQAEHVSRNQTELRSFEPDRTDDDAVYAGDHEAGPLFSSNQDCRCNRKQARKIV